MIKQFRTLEFNGARWAGMISVCTDFKCCHSAIQDQALYKLYFKSMTSMTNLLFLESYANI